MLPVLVKHSWHYFSNQGIHTKHFEITKSNVWFCGLLWKLLKNLNEMSTTKSNIISINTTKWDVVTWSWRIVDCSQQNILMVFQHVKNCGWLKQDNQILINMQVNHKYSHFLHSSNFESSVLYLSKHIPSIWFKCLNGEIYVDKFQQICKKLSLSHPQNFTCFSLVFHHFFYSGDNIMCVDSVSLCNFFTYHHVVFCGLLLEKV